MVQVWVYPSATATRVRVWRDTRGTTVEVPIYSAATHAAEREAAAKAVGDSCTAEERQAMYDAYAADDRVGLLDNTRYRCPVCSVPESLRPPHIGWPACPDPDAHAAAWVEGQRVSTQE